MCYCSNEAPFQQCCEPFISGAESPKTAEQLMRSRYSAYVVKNAQYIRETYAKEEQKHHSVEDILAFASAVDFISLEILSASDAADGSIVEFQATYITENKVCVLHERSNFILEAGLWKYLDGHIYPTPEIKLGRNDECPCGSGKKFKKCHST
ncbi:YchJ family protein [Pseudoalteromonas byunsanensis]|uniref:Preprotein translocase subunit SecA n=1 Tax=Pseudoalteromonas byunsanensis TaxID=327939 RepID=A0A1S1N4E0_9GAMM|nr:YchJ family protein [Pseudoalteromonas byunsanensis]OHU94846.1 preprotein translocase subunit SecA [Pseudoalteromonas byunsanensis]